MYFAEDLHFFLFSINKDKEAFAFLEKICANCGYELNEYDQELLIKERK